jgi:hypothetical protein
MKCHKMAWSRHLRSFQNFTNSKGMKVINWNNLKARVYRCEEPKMNMLKSCNDYPVPNDFRENTWGVHVPISFLGPV